MFGCDIDCQRKTHLDQLPFAMATVIFAHFGASALGLVLRTQPLGGLDSIPRGINT